MKSRRAFLSDVLISGAGLFVAPVLEPWPSTRAFPAPKNNAWSQVPEILKRITPPVFPRRDLVLCTNVTVKEVKIISHGPNNDGCNPESCTDVLIKDCYFDTGDDCIAVKSGRNADGRRLNVPAANVIVQGCRMKDGHGGITIGSEISGGVRNLFAENCVLDSPNLDHALRIKNNAMRGGRLESLYYRNIEVGQVAHAAITIDFNYEEGERGKFTPVVQNFVVEDLKSGKSRYALDVQGFPHAPIVNLRLEDCAFNNVSGANILKNVEGLTLRNVRINGKLI